MTGTFVDSSVWIDYFNDTLTVQARHLDEIIGRVPLIIGDIVLFEVLQGFRDDKQYRTAERLLATLDQIDVVGRDVARKAAENYRALRRRGVTIRRANDTLIATRCILNDYELLHSDRDFHPFIEHLGLRSVFDIPQAH